MEDVLVIGAGPAGSNVAGLIAERGHRVRVLEEHDAPGESVCCSGIVGVDCFARLPEHTLAIRSASSATFVSPSGKRVRVQTKTPQAFVVDRSALDRSLARRAEECGAEFTYGCTVESSTRVNNHIRVHASLHGKPSAFDARAVVVASGFSPRVAASFCLEAAKDVAVGAQAEVKMDGLEEVEIWFSSRFAPGFFAWIVPTIEDRALVGVMCRHHAGKNLRLFLAELVAQKRLAQADFAIKFGVIPLRPSKRTFSHKTIAVGDAAGQVKPTTGGGIYYGLLCGDFAAGTLDNALKRGDLGEHALSQYDKTWKRAIGGELRLGHASRTAFERLTDRNIDTLFEIVQSCSLDKKVVELQGFSFDWHGSIIRWAFAHPRISAVFGSSFVYSSASALVRLPLRRLSTAAKRKANSAAIGECAI